MDEFFISIFLFILLLVFMFLISKLLIFALWKRADKKKKPRKICEEWYKDDFEELKDEVFNKEI